jgi:DNA-binding FadR family transcriptional regulator
MRLLTVLKKALRVPKKALRVLKKALRVLKKALRVLKKLRVITIQTPERAFVQNADMMPQEHKIWHSKLILVRSTAQPLLQARANGLML